MNSRYLLLVAIYLIGLILSSFLPLRVRTSRLCLCFLTDEKEESILGSIPLLSFRVAAVQPSDNISRKHTFKVSWPSSPRSGGAGRPALLEHRGMDEPSPEGVSSGGRGREWAAAPGLSAGCRKVKVRPRQDPLLFPRGSGGCFSPGWGQ